MPFFHRSNTLLALGLVALSTGLLSACGGSDSPSTGSSTLNNRALVASPKERVASVPFASTPDPDAFYAQPDSLDNIKPGTILESRVVTFAPLGIPKDLVVKAWQLRYVTNDVNGLPVAAVATVLKPVQADLQMPKRLISYQIAYDAVGAKCTPSKSLTGKFDNKIGTAESPLFSSFLLLGYTMVIADYEGPTHAFGAGRQAGQATLDAIRAALSFRELGLSADTPVGMTGYSGGGIATSWAATLHPTYAPELKIVGAASGGTPVDVYQVVQKAENSSNFALVVGGVIGANRVYPELLPDSLLNDVGRKTINAMKDGCVGSTDGSVPPPSGTLASFTTVQDPYMTPGALAVREKVNLDRQPENPTTIPMFLYHEVNDELIQYQPAVDLKNKWCKNKVDVRISSNDLGGNHALGLVAGFPMAAAFLEGRFNGQTIVPPNAVGCEVENGGMPLFPLSSIPLLNPNDLFGLITGLLGISFP